MKYVVCVKTGNCIYLTDGKIYQVAYEESELVVVIDDSGSDYCYPKSYFRVL